MTAQSGSQCADDSIQQPLRSGGEQLGEEIEYRPHILHIQALLATRWRVPGSWWTPLMALQRNTLARGNPPPWRNKKSALIEHLSREPRTVVMISTPIGPIPYSLEDLSPWCHITGPEGIWQPITDEHEISDALDELGLSQLPLTRITPEDEIDEIPDSEDIRDWLDRCSIVDKLSVFARFTHWMPVR